MIDSKTIAAQRIRKAMEHVESAQRHLDAAGASICSVMGLAPEWNEIVRNYDGVKRCWYSLDGKLNVGRFDLDPSAQARLAAAQTKKGNENEQTL